MGVFLVVFFFLSLLRHLLLPVLLLGGCARKQRVIKASGRLISQDETRWYADSCSLSERNEFIVTLRNLIKKASQMSSVALLRVKICGYITFSWSLSLLARAPSFFFFFPPPTKVWYHYDTFVFNSLVKFRTAALTCQVQLSCMSCKYKGPVSQFRPVLPIYFLNLGKQLICCQMLFIALLK